MPPEAHDKDAFIAKVCAMIPQIKQAGLADAVDAFCEGIAFSPEQIARVFDAAQGKRPAGQTACRPAFQSAWRGAGGALRCAVGRSSRIYRRDRRRRDGAGRHRRGVAAGAHSTCCARSSFRRSMPCAATGVPIAIATDCNPGTSPITSLLLTMNMAATLFRLTVEECIAGVTREAARALGKLGRDRHASKPASPATSRSGTSSARRSLCTGSASIPCTSGSGRGDDARRSPSPARRCRSPIGASSASRRGLSLIARGLHGASMQRRGDRRRRSSPRASAVYGINTGFGKLANVRIADRDLETLQRNLVLSHAAGVGEPCPRRRRAADDGAEARQPWPRRIGRAARDHAASARHARWATSFPSCRRADRSAPRAISRRSRI